MSLPTISLVLTTIGRPSLQQSLESVCRQEWINGDELLLVDDSGTSAAREFVAGLSLPCRYIPISLQGPLGHAARNHVLDNRLANADLICSLDDDDTLEPGAFASIRRAASESPGVPLLFQIRCHDSGKVLWFRREVARHNVGTGMFVFPNDGRWGRWAEGYGGDYEMIRDTVAKCQQVVWREEVIYNYFPATSSIVKLNLLYHVTPFAGNDAWKRNVSQLLRRMHVFNGKRIIGVATRSGSTPLASLDEVKSAFGNERIDHWVTSDLCDNQQKHSPTFYPMMEFVQSSDPRESTFYAHAKGVSHPSDVMTSWRNTMYHHLLDRIPDVVKSLASNPCVGTYKYIRPMQTHMHLTPEQRKCDWHYSGTFFWFRNDAVFTRDWQIVPMNGYAVEFYLPMLFSKSEAACLFNENPTWPYHRGAHKDWPDPPDWEGWLAPSLKPAITTRHLAYHLAPMTHNNVWLKNLADLFSHLGVFNGNRVAGIVSGDGFHDARLVTELLRRRGVDTFVVPNDPWLREAKTFPELLRRCKDESPNSAIMYAHSKGVSLGLQPVTPGPGTMTPVRNPGVSEDKIDRWRRSMYRYNLEWSDRCMAMLERKCCVGSFRCTPRSATRQKFPGGEFEHGLKNKHRWHYAGSFWWARCDSLYSHPDWESYANLDHGWVTEAFPGNLFGLSDSGCVESDTWMPSLPEHFGTITEENSNLEKLEAEWREMSA